MNIIMIRMKIHLNEYMHIYKPIQIYLRIHI